MINELDRQILMILQQNARTPNAEIARQVGIVPSAVLERIRKLEERGVIQGYMARVNPRAIGLGLVAFVFVKTDDITGEGDVARLLAKLPEVLEVHDIAGEDCFLVKVRAMDTEALGRLLRERIGAIKSVRSVRTTIVLHTTKESSALPLEADQQEDGDTGND